MHYNEWSQIGQSNQPGNPNFWTDAGWNAAHTGLGAGTLGSSEIAIGTYQYTQTGDANAFQQQMGGVAAANLTAAAGIKIGQAIRAPTAPSGMTPAERAAADEFFNNPMRGPEPYIEPFDPYAPRFTPPNDGAILRNPRPGGPIPPFSNN